MNNTEKGTPEALHGMGSGKDMKTKGPWVNENMPASALVTESDLPSALASKSGSDKLRGSMIIDRD